MHLKRAAVRLRTAVSVAAAVLLVTAHVNGAELTAEQAIEKLRTWCIANEYYAASWKSTEFVSLGYRNRGFTVEVRDESSQPPEVVDTWRVDAVTGDVFLRDSRGKFKPPKPNTFVGDGGQKYGVPAPPPGARYLRHNYYMSGLRVFEAWSTPPGWDESRVVEHYDAKLRAAGWEVTWTDASERTWVHRDGCRGAPAMRQGCVAREFELRAWGDTFEVLYDEQTASGSP